MGGGGGGGWRNLGDIRSLEQKEKEALQEGKRNVFISFAHEDLNEVNLLRAHAKNENSDIEFNDHSVHEPYDSERAEYIRSRLGEMINQASTTVVLISDNTSQSQWVKWEVGKSLELGKRVIAMHVGDNPLDKIPTWIEEHNINLVPWSELDQHL